MSGKIFIEGVVERLDGELALKIPLDVGGRGLAPLTSGIGAVIGDHLIVVIKPWLAEQLRISEGSYVEVDNANGKFTITRSPKNDEQ